ncbi:hypothetical protein Rhal01_00984 [Rubritalea halochordaticola]|uniref:VCBS repeat-containing protein n=1 Tax=Rubritalea halochordaticola TaxID=714537 RepID=A0ABP9UWN2_9BACT
MLDYALGWMRRFITALPQHTPIGTVTQLSALEGMIQLDNGGADIVSISSGQIVPNVNNTPNLIIPTALTYESQTGNWTFHPNVRNYVLRVIADEVELGLATQKLTMNSNFYIRKRLLCVSVILPMIVLLSLHTVLLAQGDLPRSSDRDLLRYSIPDGGVYDNDKALLIVADMNADGLPERIAGTQMGRNGAFGIIWRVYEIKNGRYEYKGVTQFPLNSAGIIANADGMPTLQIYIGGKLCSISIDKPGENGLLEMHEIKDITWEEVTNLFKGHTPPIWSFDAQEMYKEPRAKNLEDIEVSKKTTPLKSSNSDLTTPTPSSRLKLRANKYKSPTTSNSGSRVDTDLNGQTLFQTKSIATSSYGIYSITGVLLLALMTSLYIWLKRKGN